MVEKSSGNKGEKTAISRRRITLGILLGSLAGAFGSLLALLKVLSPEKKGGGYEATIVLGDRLVYAQGEKAGTPLRAAALKDGDAVLAYPVGKAQNQANLIQLIRLKEKAFKPPTRLDLTDQGFVAYSAICTHLGCTVSWVKNQTSPDTSFTECFCHNSIFDPTRGAKVLGGPAPIPLAQVGVKVAEDGVLLFTSGFIGPIGPQV
ncbi:MAG: ubiquinol-cytochrome c reductase iron-sulfur subunit [Deltaproteobacteria bacterium]|nr:ubiquinol-cytochrome c reductase iron-sulfur subunit [Deltaproteobacteria bacterium]